MKANEKEVFEELSTQLKDWYKVLFDFVFKHGALLFLIIGWLSSSQNTREFIAKNSALAQFVLVPCLFLLGVSYSYWLWRIYKKSNHILEELSKSKYMPAHLFEGYRIQKPFAISLIGVYGMGIVFVIIVILTLRAAT